VQQPQAERDHDGERGDPGDDLAIGWFGHVAIVGGIA
jgi:hypothetical protein